MREDLQIIKNSLRNKNGKIFWLSEISQKNNLHGVMDLDRGKDFTIVEGLEIGDIPILDIKVIEEIAE